jgi:hypothetical protein
LFSELVAVAAMSALNMLHRTQKLSGHCRRLRSPTTPLFKACHDFPLLLNMPFSLGNVPIGCLQSG